MGLLSIFQRKSGDQALPAAAQASPDAVQQARTRARRRLIGASVLVVIGVIGFPLLFETQPRPISVDIPIDIPRKESAVPLVMPAARPPTSPMAVQIEAPVASAPAAIVTQSPPAGREAPAVAPPASAAAKPAAVAASRALAATPASATEARRAQALLDGQPADKQPPPQGAGRFVVQVGAFADATAARETRQRIEKLGLKTYTQIAQTSQGSRIRVRVGPFAGREEADRAQARIKASGSPAVVLTL